MIEFCLIVDFGSQYTQLIARKLRELGVRSEVCRPSISLEEIRTRKPRGLILSGGPASVSDPSAPTLSFSLDEISIPVLGICYGMQWMARAAGGKVLKSEKREYGIETVQVKSGRLLGDFQTLQVLMSHGDHIQSLPAGYRATAYSANNIIAGMEHEERSHYGFQFHPEVHHTPQGSEILRKFLLGCGFRFDWKSDHIFREMSERLKAQVKEGRILVALSGGVDSSVVAVALQKLFPENVDCLCVDTGLLRKNELEDLKSLFESKFHFPIRTIDASNEFLNALKGVIDPEAKRKIIGRTFVEVFDKASGSLQNIRYLAQGTLYPDVIESTSFHGGPSSKIKSHHNVGGLPERLPFELVEPLRDLFKDEVRRLGEYLGLPHEFVWRHPFPGPGLAIRIIGEVTPARLQMVRESDERLQRVLKAEGLYEKLWQSFCVHLPVQSVGVMGDQRTYEEVMVVRCVTSEDGMTARPAHLPVEILERISTTIINEVPGINRVVYDISSKPPATIEWE